MFRPRGLAFSYSGRADGWKPRPNGADMERHDHPDLLDDALDADDTGMYMDQQSGARCDRCGSLQVRICEPGSLFFAVCLWCGNAWL